MEKHRVIFDTSGKIRPKKKRSLAESQTLKANREHLEVPAASEDERKEIIEESSKFEKLVRKSDRVLLKIKAVFPFQFFPDTVVIDESKVSIIHRIFFRTAEMQSIPLTHIQDVEVDSSVLFATLKILPTGFSVVSMTENWVKVRYLWRNDAIKARRILSGLLIATREGIDVSKVNTPGFIEKVEELGKIN